MIPWATIMELDGLKKSNSTIRCARNGRHSSGDIMSIGTLARRANSWAFEKMKGRDRGLWGQMKEECLNAFVDVGDDSILDCCR
jgi:hypothetical protein